MTAFKQERFRVIGIRVADPSLCGGDPDFIVELRRVVRYGSNESWVDYRDTYKLAILESEAHYLGQRIGHVVNTVVDAGEVDLEELAFRARSLLQLSPSQSDAVTKLIADIDAALGAA